MSREYRVVAQNWVHPKDDNGNYIPMFRGDQYHAHIAEWKIESEDRSQSGKPAPPEPDKSRYMPQWNDQQATQYQMYETTSEGTPISPVMESKEDLARWLTDRNVNAFAGQTASYEAWLNLCDGNEAISGFIVEGEIRSGVEFAVPPQSRPRTR